MVNIEYLRRFYDELYARLVIDKKNKHQSVLLSFLDMKSNLRYRYLLLSSLSMENEPEDVSNYLINNELVRESDNITKYYITAKGIWYIEMHDCIIDQTNLISFLDEKLFNVSLNNDKLTDKERVILFAMVSARAFSLNAPIDLKKHDNTLNSWKRLIDTCYKKLYDLKLVKEMNQTALYGKQGNEHLVSHLIRHTDQLPKKTKGIFVAAGQQKYYIDISKDKKILPERLSYIIKLIINTDVILQIDDADELSEFCFNIAYHEAPYIFDMEKQTFTSPEYDDNITDAIRDTILLS